MLWRPMIVVHKPMLSNTLWYDKHIQMLKQTNLYTVNLRAEWNYAYLNRVIFK